MLLFRQQVRMFHHLRLWFFTFSESLSRVDPLINNLAIESKSAPSEAF